jgi:apolipoprotein N-acyltransferase
MWFRYLTLSFLNTILALFALLGLLTFVVPASVPGIVFRLVGWVIGFIFSLGFSYWIFHTKVPTQKDTILLAVFHVVAFMLVYSAYGVLFSDFGASVVFTLDFMVQLGLELLAILLMSYRIRRTKLQSMLGEGRVL